MSGGSPQSQGGAPPPSKTRHGGSSNSTRYNSPALTPGAQFVYGEVATLMQKISQVDRSFQEREKEFELKCAQERAKIDSEYARLEQTMESHRQRMLLEKEQLKEEKDDFEKYMDRATARMSCSEEETGLVTLSVGGDNFTTEIGTLRQKPRSIFPGRLSKVLQEKHDHNKVMKIFIDRDSRHFRLILNYLRMGEEALHGTALKNADQCLLHEVLCEARFYHLKELEQLIKWRMVYLKKRVDVTKLPVCVAGSGGTKYEIKADQTIALEECNLAGTVFDSVHFSSPISFNGCVLDGAVFNKCVFDAAVDFTNASLRGVRFEQCANVEPDKGFLKHEDMRGVVFN